MKKTFLLLMTATMMTTAANAQKLTSGIPLSNLDKTASPVEDFYQYACGGWMKANPLDAEHSRYGSFDKLADDNQKHLKNIILETAKAKNAPGSVADKIAMLYNIGMDSVRLQQQGAEPIKPYLQNIAMLRSREDVLNHLSKLHRIGIDPFFGLFGEADYENAKMNLAWLYQTGIGMGDRDYYLDDHNKEIREAYLKLMTKEFALAGYDKMSGIAAADLAEMVMALETRLAKAQYDKVTNRDPFKTFNKMTVEEADAKAPALRLPRYFSQMGLPSLSALNMAQPEYFEEVSTIMASEYLQTIKAYYAWNVINAAAGYLSDDFVMANFEFYGKTMSGTEQIRPRWKRCVSTVNGAMGEALGQLYVKKYFPPEAKKRMVTLVENLQVAFGQRIKDADWMDNTTKARAQEKLDAILVKIGYPDKWRDYSGLEIKDDSYFANIIRSNIFDVNYMLGKIDKPVDRNEWQMTPQTVNAYYNPTTNEICFPAAILQPPFFDMKADDAANYGAIGVVIGHEITHGFDDQGRNYDKDGNLADWWTPADAENFKNNAKVIVNAFNAVKVLDDPETYANGELTLGENIADNGGLHISYLAMQNAIAKKQVKNKAMDGFTPAQRFFLAYAAVWASNIRPQAILQLTTMDVHALARNRVNVTLPHISEFHDAFGVKPGNKMWLAPEKRAKLW
ncbi:MAG: M13 family metallopeptidase [Bacteroidales bacterium]|nr:M13 family metallopeptidase [Bacteroidales bacterium]